MKSFLNSVLCLALLGQCGAHPATKKRQAPPSGDINILQYALQLENLQVAFYQQALSLFSEADFLAAGLSATYFANLLQLAFDDQFHAALIEDTLIQINVAPNRPCTYKFPFTNVPTFVGLASTIEGIVTSAYQGGVPLLQTPELALNAEGILPVEALAQGIQREAAGELIASNPRGQPLSPTEVTTLIAPFIVSCPASNMRLPFTAGPPLTVTQPGPFTQRRPISLAVAANATLPSQFFVTFVSGLNTKTSVPFNRRGNTFQALVGDNVAGQTYVFISSVNSNASNSDAGIVFGPASIEVVPLRRSISAFDNLRTAYPLVLTGVA